MEGGGEGGEEAEDWECVVCGKVFRSEKAWESHERSKRHLKEVERVRMEMWKEEEELGLGHEGEGEGEKDEDEVLQDEVDLGVTSPSPGSTRSYSPISEKSHLNADDSRIPTPTPIPIPDPPVIEEEFLRKKLKTKGNPASRHAEPPIKGKRGATSKRTAVDEGSEAGTSNAVDQTATVEEPADLNPERTQMKTKRELRKKREAKKAQGVAVDADDAEKINIGDGDVPEDDTATLEEGTKPPTKRDLRRAKEAKKAAAAASASAVGGEGQATNSVRVYQYTYLA